MSPLASVASRPFGVLGDGTPVDLFVIRSRWIEVRTVTLGAIITSLRVPDREGRYADVVLGHDRLEGYRDNTPYLGAVVGRYANRIAKGRFTLDGAEYQLAANNGPNHLHGGRLGFDRRVWTATPVRKNEGVGVQFTRVSPSGEEGYPGTLRVHVTYMVEEHIVRLVYEAVTDAPTIVNLTQHSYFNLAGETSSSVLDHELTIHASRFTPVAPDLIPTGAVDDVTGTPFDFRAGARLRERVLLRHEQLDAAGGFDHNFVLDSSVLGVQRPGEGNRAVLKAALLRDPTSGRTLDIATSEPGLQFYAGHLLDGRTAAYGRVLRPHAGLCLETQHFPDSPNQPHFPAVTLRPGERYRSQTTWTFGVA